MRFTPIIAVTILALLAIGSNAGAQVDPAATPETEVSASASMFRGGPARTGELPGPVPMGKPELRWRFTAGDDIDSSPTVAGDAVYVGSDDGHLYALEATTGAERWRFEVGGEVYASPAVAAGTVYIGSGNGSIYALDAVTGAERWRVSTPTTVFSCPAVADGVVYIGSGRTIYALDASTGAEQWHVLTGGLIYSCPAVADDTVYVGSDDGNLYALDVTGGTERWRFATGDQVRCLLYTSPSPRDRS